MLRLPGPQLWGGPAHGDVRRKPEEWTEAREDGSVSRLLLGESAGLVVSLNQGGEPPRRPLDMSPQGPLPSPPWDHWASW